MKTNKKSIKIWNELLLVRSLETNKFDQKQFGGDYVFQLASLILVLCANLKKLPLKKCHLNTICSSLKNKLYKLDTSWYISKNNHHLIIATGTVSLSASLLVVSMSKTFNGMPPSLCGKLVVGPSSLPVVVAQCDKRHANRA